MVLIAVIKIPVLKDELYSVSLKRPLYGQVLKILLADAKGNEK